jgi:hypothetical protein
MTSRVSLGGVLAAAALVATTVIASVPPAPVRAAAGSVPAGWVVRVPVPDAIGGKTVIGQLTVDRATGSGYVTAYGCDDGMPTDPGGTTSRSDLNYYGNVAPVASNRLIVQADADGDVCFYTSARVDIIVDVNAVSFDVGINSFPNRRTDTRVGGSGPQVAAGGVVRLAVPEAVGGKTVIGQLTVDRATAPGYVTAYGCDDGVPAVPGGGEVTRSDLNYDGRVMAVASNRLIVQADADGEVCFRALTAVDMIIDLNATTDVGVRSFPNRRTDTRVGRPGTPHVPAGGLMRIAVPEAVGGKTVIGQLTVDTATAPGYVTAYGCDDGVPRVPGGEVTRSDLNYYGVTAVASNRLIVQADADGDVCFLTTAALDLIVDLNAVSGVGITSFPNQRTDTRTGSTTAELPGLGPVPVWPPFTPAPALSGIAALTGRPAGADVTNRPIVAVKIDNFRRARPQVNLDLADAIIEENVEGVTRFVALFQTNIAEVGPVRSARTSDLDLLNAMNRPVFGFSGANAGVTAWVASAASSGVLVDFNAQHSPCYRRTTDRPAPHNLLLDVSCAVATATSAGPGRPLWSIDRGWTPPIGVAASHDTTFAVTMDGVGIGWTWDATSGTYLRSQDGTDHLAASGARIAADTVVELFVQHVPSPVDSRSPNPISVGSGWGVVHRDGLAVDVFWTRLTADHPFTFIEVATGASVPVDEGRTFVELVRDS